MSLQAFYILMFCLMNTCASLQSVFASLLMELSLLLSLVNICLNDGVCHDLPKGGFECKCPSADYDPSRLCHVSARSFQNGSFAAFPGRPSISLQGKTLLTHLCVSMFVN